MSQLYQEGGARATSDGAIAVLQGRSVGGSTTVNWTSSFRTPAPTLKHWAAEHEVVGHGVDEMKPWFEKMEQRLGVMLWLTKKAKKFNGKAPFYHWMAKLSVAVIIGRSASVSGGSGGASPAPRPVRLINIAW